MPIKPENRARYHPDWAEIRAAILARAGHRCEGSPVYPDCRAVNRQPHPVTGSHVVLTIAHIDQMPENNDPSNLRAWCQRCHLRHDSDWRRIEREAKNP
jgi:5-methylcytosine-specific restriction endonuclease McrA